ncbi:MAG: hypothetical protein ACREO5_11360, partial [Candidatus Binatia bacterium]
MQDYADKQRRESPEHLIGYVVQRVRNHVLWDSLLIVFPPFLAISYISLFLYRTAWLATFGLSLISLGALAAALLAAVLRYRPLVPSLPAAARLVDEKAEAMDRFVTLATLGPTPSSEPLVNRLHREATAFLGRIEIRRDFPYRIKQSFYWSVAGSILALLLFHLLMIHSTAPGVSPQKRLRELTEQMAQRPHLSELARRLRSLTIKLDDPAVSPQDKQALVQEMQQEVQEQQKEEQQKDNKDLLSDTSSTLKSLEQQSGGSEQQEQKKDGVGKQTEEGQGEGKQSSGTGGESKGDLTAQANKDLQEGKSSQGDPQG